MHAITMTDILNEKIEKNQTLSSRLVYALERLKISQSELARRIGIKPQIIQYLCTSNAHKSKFAYEIASALEINPEWLIVGKGVMFFSLPTDVTLQPKVPLLLWSQINNWITGHMSISPINGNDFVLTTYEPGPNSYALKVTDTSMIPRFEVNTILILDPTLDAKHGDFVVAETHHQEQPIIRQFINRNEKNYLVPSNIAMYKEIEFTSQDKVLGIVRQTYYEFIRS